jgi:hypothetical protein
MSPDEAKACEAKIKECFANMTKTGDTAGELLYEFMAGKGPKVLGVDEAEMRTRLAKKMGVHRSTVYRIYDWVLTEIALGLPHRAINEYTARTLKTKVQVDAWGRVVEEALKKEGSYRAITASAVLKTAEELGRLKDPPAKQIDTDQGKRPSQVAEHAKVPRKTKTGATVANDAGRGRGDRSGTSADSDAEASAAEDPVKALQASWNQWHKSLHSCRKQLVNQARQMFEAVDALTPDEQRRVYRGVRRDLSRLRNRSS